MSLEIKIKNKDLNWLGKGFENNTLISPFNLSKDESFDESDKKRLIDLKIINEENEIQSNYYPMLNILSKADAYKDIIFYRGPISAKKRFFSYEDKQISVVYDKDEVFVQMPSKPKALINYLKEYTGGSSLTSGDLSLEIPAKETFIFTIIMDIYRKEIFKAISEEEVFVYKGFTVNELLKYSNKIRENSQNFSYHVFVLNSGFEELTKEEIEKALIVLMDLDCLEKKDDRYFPIGEALLFGGSFLIIENIIEVIIGQIDDNKLYRSNFLILQAGPLDLIYLEKSDENFIIENMSAIDSLEFLSSVLNEKPKVV